MTQPKDLSPLKQLEAAGLAMIANESPYTGILADWQIDTLAKAGMLTPYHGRKVTHHDGEKVLSYGLEPFGYTLTLAPIYKRPMHTGKIVFVGMRQVWEETGRTAYLTEEAEYQREQTGWIEEKPTTKHGKQWIIIQPNNFILASSVERIALPRNVQGQCLTKSTIAREGGFANITWLDAGWAGHLTIEIANLGSNPLALPVGEGVCQIVFHQGLQPRNAYAGSYQNQGHLPQEAK